MAGSAGRWAGNLVLAVALALGSAASAEPLVLAQLRIPDSIAPLPPPSCTALTGAPAGRDAFRTVKLAVGPNPITHVRLAVAGKRLVVLLPPAAGRLTLSVKAANDGAFEPVCKGVAVGGAGGPRMIEGLAPRRLAGSVWRVELVLSATANPLSQELTLLREPGSGWDADWAPLAEPLTEAEGLLCVVGRDWPERRLAGGFAGRVRLSVDTRDPDYPLTPTQSAALTGAMLRAVALWVQGCGPCRPDHLTVVEIDGQIYVRDALATFYEENLAGHRSGPNDLPGLEAAFGEALEPLIHLAAGEPPMIPRAKMFAGYRPLTGSGVDASVFCTLPTSAATPMLQAVQRAICAPRLLPATQGATIWVRFRNGATACGNSSNIIGCRADHELTEYNVRDYRFAASSDGVVIGNGAVELDLLHVLLHEMGHWIGLGHLNSGESIMASSMRQARCIDGPTMDRFSADLKQAASAQPAAFTLN